MMRVLLAFESAALWLVWAAAVLTLSMVAAIVVERVALARYEAWRRRIELRYGPLVERALAGDAEARGAFAGIPSHHRIEVARLVITPLVDDRDPARVATAREIARALSLLPLAARYLRSPWWWRRVLALRALGLIQATDQTGVIVAALDDRNPDVRGAALDAIADLQDPAALPALVLRMHDATLHAGRRAAALASFGTCAEALVLEVAGSDPGNRVNYAKALGLCGTARARPVLCDWTVDRRSGVRIAALEALAQIGLDQRAASVALDALESPVVSERAVAAGALRGWTGSVDAASRLGRHLGDPWPVAVNAARALQSMREAGRLELETCAARPDLAGRLARQMLWEAAARL